jgi:hypothetical protein
METGNMRDVGPLSEFPELSEIVGAIFNRQFLQVRLSNGQIIKASSFQPKNLWYVDHNGMRYVEQNPNSKSEYADRARSGARIIWVIRKSDNQYLGRVDGDRVFAKPEFANGYQTQEE